MLTFNWNSTMIFLACATGCISLTGCNHRETGQKLFGSVSSSEPMTRGDAMEQFHAIAKNMCKKKPPGFRDEVQCERYVDEQLERCRNRVESDIPEALRNSSEAAGYAKKYVRCIFSGPRSDAGR